jgi:hypothetical protein
MKILIAIAAAVLLVLGWGYWHSVDHAYVQLRVDDYSLKSATQAYGAPHGVTLELRDAAGTGIAMARSVEPHGYILAVHPDPAVGNCEHLSGAGHADCYERYSAWSATWAPRVRSAQVSVGSCVMRDVPVSVRHSNEEWLVWWVPLPHVGGLPRQYFDLSMAMDSHACATASRR